MLIICFAIFFLLELSVRSIDFIRGESFISNKHRNIIAKPVSSIIPYRIFGTKLYYEESDTKYISSVHNEHYPLKKPNNTFRIICFGGSTTANVLYETTGIHYPLVLQGLLQSHYPNKNIEVINLGYYAYATSHAIILLTLDVLSWSPDLIILSNNINDLLASYWPDFTYDYSNKYRTGFYSMPDYPERFTTLNALFNWSSFYWALKNRLKILSKKLSGVNEPQDGYMRKSYGDEPPVTGQDVFRRNLTTFVSIAKSYGLNTLLATQPLETSEEYWDKHMSHKKYNNIVVYPLHSEFVSHHQNFNKIIKEVAKKTDIFFLDNNAIFSGDKRIL